MRSVPVQHTYGGFMAKGMKSYVIVHDRARFERKTRMIEWLKEQLPGVNVTAWSADGKVLRGNYAWSICQHNEASSMGVRVDSSFRVIRLPRHIDR